MFAVNSACENDNATNEIAPRLYTSSGCAICNAATNDGRSARSPGTNSTNGNSACNASTRGLFCPFTIPNT